MGDRVLFQCVMGKEFSPVFYGHWSGDNAPEICKRLAVRMKGRSDDLAYVSARLAQELVGTDNGNLGYGIWNADKILTEDDSHGDAGVILIHCSESGLGFECFGGYLETNGKTFQKPA